jgi:hypothetical protein
MLWQQLAIVVIAVALGALLGGYGTLILLAPTDEGERYAGEN